METISELSWIEVVQKLLLRSGTLLLCEMENVHIAPYVENPEILSYRLPVRKDLMLVKDHIPRIPRPLVGKDWAEVITEIAETTLKQIFAGDRDEDDSDNPYQNLHNQFESGAEAFMFSALWSGAHGLAISDNDTLTIVASKSDDLVKRNPIIDIGLPEVHNDIGILVAAIGLIGYWQRQGADFYCPFAKFFGTLMEIGFYSMIPMFNLTDLEKVRPVWQECLANYGPKDNMMIDLIEMLIFKDDGKLTGSEEREVGSSTALLYAMLKEEQLKAQELHNAEEA